MHTPPPVTPGHSPSPTPPPSSSRTSRSLSPASGSTKKIKPPTSHELESLYSSLSKCKSKPAILALVNDYSAKYVPK